ncbi:replication-relaxation family protein [Streptomyces sp. NPDC059766]|uniref:replication-relaxation family protein n=1 Tax=Streptomyces sp. NPDC059766 TaxID=3346940 RepID=UPI0036538072
MTTPFETASCGHTPSPVEPLPHQLLAVLGQHRMATTSQLHDLLRPDAARQTVSAPLNKLRRDGLVDYTVLPQSNRTRAWYLTGEGARLVRDLPALRGRPPYPITSATAASLKTPHTLTVLRTHLAFVADARKRGDEHGHLDWTPEVSHPLGDGEKIITDALMHYTLTGEDRRTKLRAFVEVDRTTMSSERLAAKLIEYARLWSYESQPVGRQRSRQPAVPGAAWLRWYPVFPRILFVLTGATPYVLGNRISDLQAMTAQHPLVATLARQVPLGAATLDDLELQGPTGDVWVPLTGGDPKPWTEL